MADQRLPLLVLPKPEAAVRDMLAPGYPKMHFPSFSRQRDRLGPQFKVLQEVNNLQLGHSPPTSDPESVVVLEIIGTVKDFSNAVANVPELIWMNEWESVNVDPDEDFYNEDEAAKKLGGQIYLIGTNREALTQLLLLWERWANEQSFAHGLGRWKNVFRQLKYVGFWDKRHRLTEDVISYWNDVISDGVEKQVRFEIDAWCYPDARKNQDAFYELSSLLKELGGIAVSNVIINEIGYHGILASLPTSSIRRILEGTEDRLVASNRIMYFRPKSQAIMRAHEGEPGSLKLPVTYAERPPVVALLDGLPMQNHPLLREHLIVDDPDNWAENYQAHERIHGTAMASLIIHDELDAQSYVSTRKIYVRPIMCPDVSDTFNARRPEHTPNDVLIIDLIHRAVRRIFDGDGDQPAAAKTVKIINLSIGDLSKPFALHISPWARLIDWLSWKYGVLFVISAGNHSDPIYCAIPGAQFDALPLATKTDLTLKAITASASDRSIISPAESINAITVGALHHDSATYQQLPPDVYDLLPSGSVSPVTRVGLGYRRAIKPDVLFPGGRQLYRRQIGAAAGTTTLHILDAIRAPGHKVAYPSKAGAENSTAYCRGTSNAAAIATRHAASLYDVIETLKATYEPDALPDKYDAVLLKAMVVHGASWADPEQYLKQARPEFVGDHHIYKRFISRWLGFGPVVRDYGLFCTPERATMIGVGEVKKGAGMLFRIPLPPSLAGKKVERRLIITLAWMSPLNHASQAYRKARLWFSPPKEHLNVGRQDAQWQSARRGTLQHEILSGDEATSYSKDTSLVFKVSCAEEAGKLADGVPFALIVSLEVAPGHGVQVYQEIADVIAPKVTIAPITVA